MIGLLLAKEGKRMGGVQSRSWEIIHHACSLHPPSLHPPSILRVENAPVAAFSDSAGNSRTDDRWSNKFTHLAPLLCLVSTAWPSW